MVSKLHVFHNGPNGMAAGPRLSGGRGRRGGMYMRPPEFVEAQTVTVSVWGSGLWWAPLAAWLVAVFPWWWFGTLPCRFLGIDYSYWIRISAAIIKNLYFKKNFLNPVSSFRGIFISPTAQGHLYFKGPIGVSNQSDKSKLAQLRGGLLKKRRWREGKPSSCRNVCCRVIAGGKGKEPNQRQERVRITGCPYGQRKTKLWSSNAKASARSLCVRMSLNLRSYVPFGSAWSEPWLFCCHPPGADT